MARLIFNIDTVNHLITITNIKMNQNRFSYNNVTFTKLDNNSVSVKYNKETPENEQHGIDCNLTWGLNSIMSVLSKYSKPGCNPYDENYVILEFDF